LLNHLFEAEQKGSLVTCAEAGIQAGFTEIRLQLMGNVIPHCRQLNSEISGLYGFIQRLAPVGLGGIAMRAQDIVERVIGHARPPFERCTCGAPAGHCPERRFHPG
jgi:hypothetical protein